MWKVKEDSLVLFSIVLRTWVAFIYSAGLKRKCFKRHFVRVSLCIFCVQKSFAVHLFFSQSLSMRSNMRYLAGKNVRVKRRSRGGSETVDQRKMARNSCIKWTVLPVCEIAAHSEYKYCHILMSIKRRVASHWAMFFWPYASCCCLWAPTKRKRTRKMWKIEKQLAIIHF